MPAQIVGFYAYLAEFVDDRFEPLYSNACTHDEAIGATARYLRENKLDGVRIHIRERGEYLAEVVYHGWNGGRIEVEDFRDPPIVDSYQLTEDNKRVYTHHYEGE